MNEPHMAPWWFPANDHPRDKALMDISITVPRDKKVVANGRLAGARCTATRRPPAGGPTSRWCRTSRSSRPATTSSTGPARRPAVVRRGVEADPAAPPGLVDEADAQDAEAGRLARQAARRLPVLRHRRAGDGARPRLRAGEPDPADLPAVGAGATLLVVHEQAHQWFGDSVVGGELARHLAQRGSRDLHGGALRRDPRRPERPTSGSGTATTARTATPSGTSGSATRARTTSSTARSTTAVGWRSRPCATGSARTPSGPSCGPGSPTARTATARPTTSRRWPRTVGGEPDGLLRGLVLHRRAAEPADNGGPTDGSSA